MIKELIRCHGHSTLLLSLIHILERIDSDTIGIIQERTVVVDLCGKDDIRVGSGKSVTFDDLVVDAVDRNPAAHEDLSLIHIYA